MAGTTSAISQSMASTSTDSGHAWRTPRTTAKTPAHAIATATTGASVRLAGCGLTPTRLLAPEVLGADHLGVHNLCLVSGRADDLLGLRVDRERHQVALVVL